MFASQIPLCVPLFTLNCAVQNKKLGLTDQNFTVRGRLDPIHVKQEGIASSVIAVLSSIISKVEGLNVADGCRLAVPTKKDAALKKRWVQLLEMKFTSQQGLGTLILFTFLTAAVPISFSAQTLPAS